MKGNLYDPSPMTRFLLGFLAGFVAFPAGVLVALGWAVARGETR